MSKPNENQNKGGDNDAAAKAKAEAEALVRLEANGPVARCEIRLDDKTYKPGARLPIDEEDDVFDELEAIGAI
ncbi:hypothetical protein BR10RB9215_C11515 [Brucella sp. 10RB9215]|uniref:hypothetical protein n=1 Tax=Brucella sp. 10RB9215 TaxID=1149953 RepID=UPI00090B8A36|nr:hypothetical protein [Brucella sp. 10RB9215]SBW14312.1 hypothetical protein BR10RB9215_C11138 [Brucella sp. 10RB9215]SBW14677.1 hypothetical protein BR10RB9215_C11515 [Brucella sp. 10RB9215]